MFLEVVRSQGLAHLSYIVGDGGRAAVIDPRRDWQIYVEIAYRQGAQITHIFETHRNEDYVIGSLELAGQTGADIYHGWQLPFEYGNAVREGDEFQLGEINLTVLETPGHTYESISIVLADTAFSDRAAAVFTGDALFIGDVGRTDFFPDKAEEVAALLYDSIFQKILPLGDHVILYPAHGAGSVCGSGMAAREFSTLGYERAFNRALQVQDRDEFIQKKVNEHHYQPPYFKRMEEYNLKGAPPLAGLPAPRPYGVRQFAKAMEDGMTVLDIRSPEAFAAAFIPGSLAIPLDMLPAFAGYYLSYQENIGLVVEKRQEVALAVRYLNRLGYDRVVCYLEGGLTSWETSGCQYDGIPAVYAGEIKRRIEAGEEFTLLDVRSTREFTARHLRNAFHIYVGDLPEHLDRVPRERPVTTFCGSGQRAIIAASILKKNGFKQVEDCLGSMEACDAVGCPLAGDDAS
ncbi:MBL fold metallo-hydrolase [Desulfoferrobacter suflitae]|uniref:MBL fold metallo-hydrolase n=1 Tax=Desulfoferrobacter suflitae TaxID=2865782 RepID=UPI002164BA2F|nr:MBL fold metallo-hydrolase [Desulfoferrobacter suflitae]MCK8603822.1 MBL fold metallo-hydrolase [Desulfoferrobacter suflitae]